MLEPILKETFGVIIYQEQVMQIAQVMAGYSLGEADLLRRAMGKKIRAEMEQQRDRFVSGAVERGIQTGAGRGDLRTAGEVRRLRLQQEPCGGLRAGLVPDRLHEGALSGEFLAASMTLELSNTDKLSEFRAEALRLGIKVEPPSINRSGVMFDVTDGHHLLCAGRAERGWRAGGRVDRRGARRHSRSPRSGRLRLARAANAL